MTAGDRIIYHRPGDPRGGYSRDDWPEGCWLYDGTDYPGTVQSVHPDKHPWLGEDAGYAVLALDHGATIAVDYPASPYVRPEVTR